MPSSMYDFPDERVVKGEIDTRTYSLHLKLLVVLTFLDTFFICYVQTDNKKIILKKVKMISNSGQSEY
jgi:hypothetical protein